MGSLSGGLQAQIRFGSYPDQPITHPVEAIEMPRYRLRVVWGGGAATAWQGNLVLSSGRFENLNTLGLEPDAAASLEVTDQELRIRPVREAEFGGFDVDVVGCQGHRLQVTLQARDLGVGIQQQTVDLTPLLEPQSASASPSPSIQLSLDDSGNRLDFSRSPGDRLPLHITRSHLVFDPGEEFVFDLHPFLSQAGSGDNLELQVEVFAQGETRSRFDETFELRKEDSFWVLAAPVRLSVPMQEGVYDVRVSVREDSLVSRLNLNRQRLSRSMQLVVLERMRPQPLDRPDRVVLWSEVFNSEDTRSPWIDRIPGVPQFKLASSGSSPEPLRNSGVASTVMDGKSWNRFEAGGWQAVPIQVSELGKPHMIEIEFLDDGPLAVGVSVLQPNAAGQVEPFGVDSGISVSGEWRAAEPVIRRHRIFFWPSHEQPLLLFANRHANRPAMIGAIRVLAGPDRLAASESTDGVPAGDPAIERRQYVSFYEKPLFAENFAAAKAFDPASGQTWQDWNSFLVGALRWVEYLKANGYTSAMLVVAGDGSALYPSPLWQPNPGYDNGAFSPQGADPVRKDVVELLLRIFAREGLQLVPVMHFNSPLPALEQQRLTGAPDVEGITLVDLQGGTRLATLRDGSSPVSIYNPLDPRVQSAYTAIVSEFVERYAGHRAALGGLGFLYSQDSLQVLPGQSWGVDRTTLRRFQQQTGTEISAEKDWFVKLLSSENRASWLSWRQQQMGQWLDVLQQAAHPLPRLYLLGGDLFETQDAFSALAPSLRRTSDLSDAMSRVGVPFERISQDANLVFLHPSEQSPEKSLAEKRLSLQLNQSGETDPQVREFKHRGTLFSHHYSWAEFDQLQHQKLFDQPQTQSVMRLQPLIPAGDWNRRHLARSIAEFDSQTLVEGGWLTGFGQEEHLTPLVDVFTRLPNVRFQDVPLDPDAQGQMGVVVRQAAVQQQNWFYVVNPTPWKLVCRIRFSGSNTLLNSVGVELAFDGQTDEPTVQMELEPFSLQAGSTAAVVQVIGFQVQPSDAVTSQLQNRLNALLTKVSLAAQVDPVPVLENPGLEPVAPTGDAPRQFGWSFDKRAAEAVTLNQQQAFAGKTCLSLVSGGTPTWIRSNEFEAPVTGRLSISVMIRTDDPDQQPPLRISVQGDDGRQVYYRYGMVGGPSRRITEQWQEFAVHFDDLPLRLDKGGLQIGFDLMGRGRVDIDQVRVFDRWLDGQDSRALTEFLALAGFQLTNKQNLDRCRQILDSYWPRFLEEFFPDPAPQEPSMDGLPLDSAANQLSAGSQRLPAEMPAAGLRR